MTWTWNELSDVVRRLELPPGDYVVNNAGTALAEGRVERVDAVELLVTARACDALHDAGWRWLTENLAHPELAGLSATRHPDRRYRAGLTELITTAKWVDGVPVVSHIPVRSEDEHGRIRRPSLNTTGGGLLAVPLFFVTMVYGWALLFGGAPQHMVQHLGFQTFPVTGTVTGTEEAWRKCRSSTGPRKPKIRVDFSWPQGGEQHTGTITDCGSDLTRGDTTTIWVTDSGDVADLSGPQETHTVALVVGGIAFLVALLIAPPKKRKRS